MHSLSRRVLGAFVLSLLFVACDTRPAADAVDPRSQEQAIREAAERYNRAAVAGDVETLVNMYADDAMIMQPGEEEPIRGREAIRGHYLAMMQFPNREFTSTPTRIDVARSGDLASEAGVFSVGADTPQGRFTDTGRYLTVWKKIDEQWRIATEISHSTSSPAPEPQP